MKIQIETSGYSDADLLLTWYPQLKKYNISTKSFKGDLITYKNLYIRLNKIKELETLSHDLNEEVELYYNLENKELRILVHKKDIQRLKIIQ